MVTIHQGGHASSRASAAETHLHSIVICRRGSRVPVAPTGLHHPPATAPVGACRPTLTEEELAVLYADLGPLVQRLLSHYGREPALQAELEPILRYQFRLHVERYDPACGRPLKAHLVSSLSLVAHLWARSRWASSHLDQELASASTDDTRSVAALACSLAVAVSQLPLRQRQAVIGWFYEGRSIDEIAGRLGMRRARVRSLLRRGINTLRRLQFATEAPCRGDEPTP